MPLLLLASLLPADASASPDGSPPQQAAVEDLTDVAGSWIVVAYRFTGRQWARPTEGSVAGWTFTPGLVTMDYDGGARIRLGNGFHMDRSAAPPALDVLQSQRAVFAGIYRRAGDLLIWESCEEGHRPGRFTLSDDYGYDAWILRRARR
jgi:uncharacterized protein (TIGR03067 family)